MIKELSEMICLSHDFKKITERRTQYDRRAAAACLHMDQSNENISNLEDPDSKVTYAAEWKAIPRNIKTALERKGYMSDRDGNHGSRPRA
ncbi:hypothetical protein HID58_043525 [Brassica napus]|uniref:Uncharacterized protein n=1 Tax=Brassica napus TaxID=3708 RepID=A0ABQ8BGR2_BRANA|nr:hypothetical protein HID58_043525 [Brassica napus]